MKVELDKKSLFALASDTRLEILRSLQPMRRTVTQLSDALSIDKAAVHRHLKKMEEGDLVKRFEDHGFVYYGLSWKARDLLSPNENTKIVILLSCSYILILAFALIAAFSAYGATHEQPGTPGGYLAPTGTNFTQENRDIHHGALGTAQDWERILFLSSPLLIVPVALVAIAVRINRRPRQPNPAGQDRTPGENNTLRKDLDD